MSRLSRAIVLSVLLSVACSPSLPQEAPEDGGGSVLPTAVLEGHVSLASADAPLGEVLSEIARQLGVRWGAYLPSAPPVVGVWYEGAFGALAAVLARVTGGEWLWVQGTLIFHMPAPSPTEEYLQGVERILERSQAAGELCASLTPQQIQQANQDWYLYHRCVWGGGEGLGLVFDDLEPGQQQIVRQLWAGVTSKYRLTPEQVPLTRVKYVGWGRIEPSGALTLTLTLEAPVPREDTYPFHVIHTFCTPCPPDITLPEHFFQFGIAPEEWQESGAEG